tara:strand:- start:569 stop:967 length:399 start_codon:yes stop_codon:yes gene_type:complete
MEYIQTDGGRKAAGYKTTRDYQGDCVVRSISIALDQPYTATFLEMMELGMEMGGYPNIKPVYEEYLRRKGWVKQRCPRDFKNKLIKLEDWIFRDTAIVLNSGHLTCVKDGAVHDSWDCRYRPVNTYYVKGAA